MREIKFRIWRIEKKEMYPSSSIWKMNLWGCDFPDDIILMEFTGLLDKQNKEIYEGDILNDRYYLFQVTFWSGAFWCQPVDEANEAYNLSLLHDHNMTGEIIGNIYENPELINV